MQNLFEYFCLLFDETVNQWTSPRSERVRYLSSIGGTIEGHYVGVGATVGESQLIICRRFLIKLQSVVASITW